METTKEEQQGSRLRYLRIVCWASLERLGIFWTRAAARGAPHIAGKDFP